jgi:hypothetical protein
MEREPITLLVDEDAARVFRAASAEEQEQIGYDVAMKLRRRTSGRKPLSNEEMFALMDTISDRAEAHGLTPEILQSILDEK